MKYFVITFVLLLQFNSIAQKHIDLVNVYWRTSPLNTIENGSDLKRNFNTYVVDAKLPIVLNDQNVFISGIEYQQNSITINDDPFNGVFDYNFASSTIQTGLEHKWNSTSKMLFLALGRLNTDYSVISSADFQLGGLVFGTTERTEDFHWKYGLYYNSEFFGNMFVPLFGFNWKINEKWRLKTVVPINFELTYQPKQNFRTGLRFDGVNGSYHFKGFFAGSSDQYLDKADNNLWLFSEIETFKNCWFHVKAGYSILRKYRFYSENEKLGLKLGPVNIANDRPDITPLFTNGLSFEARFIYRLPLD